MKTYKDLSDFLNQTNTVVDKINNVSQVAINECHMGKYENSAYCFNLCYQMQSNECTTWEEGAPDQQLAKDWPLLALDNLKNELSEIKSGRSTKSDQDAFVDFRNEIYGRTNTIYEAQINGTRTYFTSIPEMQESIKFLNNIKVRLNVPATRDVMDDVNDVIKVVESQLQAQTNRVSSQ
jgi:hypothetical protein